MVICQLAGANRDARLGAKMDAFDLSRPVSTHLAFGHGFHRCVGAELARMELRTAFPAIARRFPDLTLATDRVDYRQLSIVYGVDALPVRLQPEPVPPRGRLTRRPDAAGATAQRRLSGPAVRRGRPRARRARRRRPPPARAARRRR